MRWRKSDKAMLYETLKELRKKTEKKLTNVRPGFM